MENCFMHCGVPPFRRFKKKVRLALKIFDLRCFFSPWYPPDVFLKSKFTADNIPTFSSNFDPPYIASGIGHYTCYCYNNNKFININDVPVTNKIMEVNSSNNRKVFNTLVTIN
ncbi:CLUMA_CG003673, isoform A [Clunio marinus]|uniref:CLUMA_CG003673, isoform A n=1 Tax=Clunio marinus TaxID=568069 RepID=A0A1J1HPG5_9DIPT|nr:CLUMA_CG003673, isoform A [Clunio marinus]